MQARRIDSNATIYTNEWRNARQPAAWRVEFQTSILQVDTANILRDRHLTRRLLWTLALVWVISNARRSWFRLFDDIKRDPARTSLDPSITKASKIRRQVFDGNPRTIGPWLAFISAYIAICNARCHRNSILSRWSISNVCLIIRY